MDITAPFQSALLNSKEKSRILPNLIESGECWIWTAGQNGVGYGQCYVMGRVWLLHRLAWFLTNGAIEPGLQLDHLCRNRSCYRPSHLEPVTLRANVVERGEGLTAINAKKTHCIHNHPLDGENLYEWVDKKGGTHRTCRQCVRDAKKRFRAKAR